MKFITQAHRYVITFYVNKNFFVFESPFYHHYIQKPVPKNFQRNVQMRLISHRQQEPSEIFVDLQKPEPILKNF